MENIIKLDKFHTKIPPSKYVCHEEEQKSNDLIGLYMKFDDNDNLSINMSGKPFATPNDLGAITLDNYTQIPDIIYNSTGIEIDKDYLLNQAQILTAHVKTDISLDGHLPDYISLIREIFKRNTDKFDVYRYSDLTYENGLQIIPKTDNKDFTGLAVVPKNKDNYRFIIYLKKAELDKYDNKEYKKIFDYNFLEKVSHMIRFEYQMRKFEDMRNAFGIYNLTLSNILHSTENPVFKFFMTLLNDSEKEVNYENI